MARNATKRKLTQPTKKSVAKKGTKMSREEVREFIKTNFGIEPTDEQVSAFLNTHNKEVQKEKDNANMYKDDAKRAEELQKQLDELNEANLTEVEKAKKDADAQSAKVAELTKQIELMQRKASLAEKGIVGEDAEKLFKADGSLDIDAFGAIIADREAKAKSLAEQELLKKTPDAGNGGKGGEDNKVDDLTKSVIDGLKGNAKASEDIINKYR